MDLGRRAGGDEKKNHFGLVVLDPEKPSPTILSGIGGTTTGLVHPWEIRKLTIDEAKALASYPKAFEIRGGYNARWARIGNSVPPLFMRSIALYIRREVLDRETHDSLGTACLPDREDVRRKAC